MSPPRRPAAANNQVVRAHLARKTLPEFLSQLEEEGRRRELVTLSPGATLAEASAALAAAGVLSAPVIDPESGSSGPESSGGAFRGFFDVADYLRAVVELARERSPELLLLQQQLQAPPPESSSSAAAAAASAAAPASSSSSSIPLADLLLAAANDDQRTVRDCAHAAGEAWFRADDEDSSMLDVVVSGFRATAKSGSKGSSSSSAAFLAAAADPLSRPAHRVAVFGIERQDGKRGEGEGGGGGETPSTTATAATTTADGPTLSWRVRGVVSQSDVISYIAERSEEEFEPALRQSVAELGFAPGAAAARSSPLLASSSSSSSSTGASSSPLVVLPAGTPALAAFATMASRRASAVALVDEDGNGGALLACLTNSDLRGFRGGAEHFAALLRPAAEVAAAVAAEAESPSGRGGIWAPGGPLLKAAATTSRDWKGQLSPATARLVSVTPGACLGEALRRAAAARVHRVWVVEGGESGGKPVGVIGLGDILRVLVQEEDE